jgi:hypothetical protein
MVEISSAFITTIIGMMGVVIGAIISNYFNQKIARQAAKKEIMFKKRVEYFEKIVECVEKNTKMYESAIKKFEKDSGKRSRKNILEKMKKERLKFEIMTSPLYLDTRPISKMIRHFVNIEKRIFLYLETDNEEDKLRGLKENYKQLRVVGDKIIFELRTNLLKE